MYNPYHSELAKITKISPQTETISLFRFEFVQKVWGYNFSFSPGQFIELSLPGFGEAPFAPCNAPGTKYLELCIRDIGHLTHKLHEMKVGDKVGIRGPYGRGWPTITNSKSQIANRNILIVVGGLGLIPLRTLILGKNKFLGKDTKVQVFYGTKAPQEMLFRYEYNRWRKNGIDVKLTVDKECANWVGCVGLVTTLFDKYPIAENATAFLCGPPVMYKFVLEKLKQKGSCGEPGRTIADENIYLSLERRMHCGLGVCQHCAVGPYYTCKDGPVFCYKQLKNIPGAI